MSGLDLVPFAEAKSEQLVADDLIGGPRTIKITRVAGDEDTKKVSIYFEGDGGKPFQPCKTVIRVLMGLWGKYASEYVGRSLTLYRDADVEFGGIACGGIRVSHASHIDADIAIMVAKTRGKKSRIIVKPLKVAPATEPELDAFGLAPVPQTAKQTPEQWVEQYLVDVKNCEKIEELMDLQSRSAKALAKLQTEHPDLHDRAVEAGVRRAAELQGEAVS